MSDRAFERAVQDWLADGSDRTPRYAIDAVLLAVKTTPQQRDLVIPRIAWRPRTMFDRLAVAAVTAAIAIGGFTLTYSLVKRPTEPAAGPCPTTVSEADAFDTSTSGLSQSQRAWGIAGGTPPVRPGLIAGFADDPPNNVPGTVVLLDPASGNRCFLIRLVSDYQIGVPVTSLDWSPSGEALALALTPSDPDGDGKELGAVLVWTPHRLHRIWSGNGSPRLAWAPDGRSIAVWADTPGGFDTRLIFADGTPDRTFSVLPNPFSVYDSLQWSPDGTDWVVAEALEGGSLLPDTAVAIVQVPDGRTIPLDLGTGHFEPMWWTSNDAVIVQTQDRERGVTGYLDVPIEDPSSLGVLFGPDDNPGYYARRSPDGRRLLFMSPVDEDGTGELNVMDIAAGAGETSLRLAPGLKVGSAGFSWSPDGSQVLFHVLHQLWAVNADGSGLRQLTSGGVVAIDDPWQPVQSGSQIGGS